jgi:DNA-binding MarR family transcriptional regulator
MAVTDTGQAGLPTGIGRAPVEERLAGNTGYLTHLTARRAEQLAQPLLPPGRDTRDVAVLSVLAEGPVSQARLGDLLDVNRTVMITVIDRLEQAGLVLRERDPADRRRYALRITAAGTAALDRMITALREADDRLLAGLASTERGQVRAALERIDASRSVQLPAVLAGLAGFLAGRVARRLRAENEAEMRSRGLEFRCVKMLVPLDSAQPCTQEQLAARMGLASPTIVAPVDELHDSGLISRERNPGDRREHVLRLTADGLDYLERALEAQNLAQERLAESAGPTAAEELNSLLIRALTS